MKCISRGYLQLETSFNTSEYYIFFAHIFLHHLNMLRLFMFLYNLESTICIFSHSEAVMIHRCCLYQIQRYLSVL